MNKNQFAIVVTAGLLAGMNPALAQSQAYQQPPIAQPQASAQPAVSQPAAAVQPQAVAQPTRRAVFLDERTNQLVEVAPQVQQETVQQPIQQSPQVLILNNQLRPQAAQPQYQDQPPTLVQDAPLKTSPAEAIRKQRQDAEAGTEDGIVQALEKARLEDEMHRRDRFNGAIGQAAPQGAPQQTQVAPQAVQPQMAPQQVAPAVVVAPPPADAKEDKVDVKQEIRAALKEANEEKPKAKQNYYFAGIVGTSKYPDVVNVKSSVNGGVAVGMETSDRVIVEGSFVYGSYSLQNLYATNSYGYAPTVSMKQYNLVAEVKYALLPGRLQPTVGALASYARRAMTDDLVGVNFRNTDAIDAGLSVGLGFQFTDNFALGFDFKYFTNITYNNNTNAGYVYSNTSGKDIEQLDYYIAGLTGRLTF
jgi:hypothetical protein